MGEGEAATGWPAEQALVLVQKEPLGNLQD